MGLGLYESGVYDTKATEVCSFHLHLSFTPRLVGSWRGVFLFVPLGQ